MPRQWNAAKVIVDSASLTAGSPTDADTSGLIAPTVVVKLEDLEGNADDTLTVRYDGAAATYEAHTVTLSATGTETVDVPQTPRVEIESSNGVTYSAEVRADPSS